LRRCLPAPHSDSRSTNRMYRYPDLPEWNQIPPRQEPMCRVLMVVIGGAGNKICYIFVKSRLPHCPEVLIMRPVIGIRTAVRFFIHVKRKQYKIFQ